mgnify:CR=1 FL=1
MLVSVVPIGNSRGIRFPKLVLDKFLVKDKMNMEVTDKGILLTPVNDAPRSNWAEAFCKMHENKEDVLEEIPASGAFEWEW